MKKALVTILSVIVILGVGYAELSAATMHQFTKKYVDSNTYTTILSPMKMNSGSTATLKVTAIYKANGNASNYKYVLAKATMNGKVYQVEKGYWYDLTIPENYRYVGRNVGLCVMGNDPSLDCQISGYWCVY